MSYVLIFPNTLFEQNDLIKKGSTVLLLEHPVFFERYAYHKMKIVLHRASMKSYESYIKKKYKCKTEYVNFDKVDGCFRKMKNKALDIYDPVDHLVEADIRAQCKKHNVDLTIHDTKLFIEKKADLLSYAKKNKTGTFNHAAFYAYQRKKYSILLKKDGKPLGGKWSFDIKNRLPFPNRIKNYKPKVKSGAFIKEAISYVDKFFPNNPGTTDNFIYEIDHAGAKRAFDSFLKTRLSNFGPYQDAVSSDIPFGFHSMLSSSLNIGLITPEYVITESEKFGRKNKIRLESLEGFIRQILGWRSMVYMLYCTNRTKMEKSNHFNHTRKLDKDVWYSSEYSTGFDVIDSMIDKTIDYAYLHHIERLMYVGNFLLINQISPKDCFEWFMCMFIDSYNWVMYANVYAMSQYSTGKFLMTRPYFSSSNYIHKMSSYKKQKGSNTINLDGEDYEWYEVWDALYYNFISENRTEFKKNYAIAAQVKHLDSKTAKQKRDVSNLAKLYFDEY